MPDALQIRRLSSGYGETVVLEDVALTLPERGSLAVLGRNGVGKTTLLATIMGHTTLHAGSVLFNGKPIQKLLVHQRSRAGIGYVPQAREIFPSLTVEENLAVAEKKGGSAAARWTLERVYALFPRLKERERNLGTQLSGGEQQMLAIGRALMTNPRLLVLDEATEGLAPLVRTEIWRCLAELKREGLTLIVIDKNIAPLARLADRHYIVEKGRVAWQGDSQALLADPALLHQYVGV